MNSSRKSPSANARRRGGRTCGFTLAEILVAVAILAIIVIMLGQMLGTMSRAWNFGHARANNFTKARAMLDLLAQDIQSGIFRPDLAAFPASLINVTPPTFPSWEFYTARPGVPTNTTPAGPLRNVSVVQYTFIGPTNPNAGGIPNTLERADDPLVWGDATLNAYFGNLTAFPGPTTPRDTAPGVIAFDVIFIQSDGSFSTTFTPVQAPPTPPPLPASTRAVSISLAVIDDQTIAKLSSAQLTTLNSSLTAAVTDTPPKQSIKSYWDAYLNGTSMNWKLYPQGTGAGLATFERYVTLPTSP
jgi:prepilin-type N-terminal cleavage/methylation domain-containing protein